MDCIPCTRGGFYAKSEAGLLIMDQNSRQMPATIDHALDSHGTTDKPEEDDIAADGRDARASCPMSGPADGLAGYSVSHETWHESPERS